MDQLPLIRKTFAFILTLVALPVLFVGTCVPIGIFADRWSNGPGIPFAILAFTAVFIAVAIRIAIHTSNPGIRWAIIVQLALAGIAATGWAIQLFLH